MAVLAVDLLSAALGLSEPDRLDLASKLIASVDGEADPGWDEAWLAELDRREAAAAAGGDPGSNWADAKARILGRLGSK
jgi:putative addiction module component (TIGR02574 family)